MAASGYTPISLYYSTTASAAPTAGNLVSGELAINITDGKLYYKDNAGAVQLLSTSTTATGTANGVLYLNGSKVATSGSALVFDGTSLGVGTGTIPSGVKTVIASPNTAVNSRGNLYVYTTDTATADYGAQLALGGSFSGTAEAPFAAIAGRWVGGTTGYMQFSILNSGTIAEQMRLNSTGLGIGTSSPSTKLHVKGNVVSNFGVLTVQDSGGAGTSAYPVIALYDSASTHLGDLGMFAGDQVVANLTATGKILFKTNSTTVATIDSSGNLGLGVTPSAWGSGHRALDIGSNSYVSGSTSMTVENNVYFNGTNNIYKNTAAATQYQQTNAGTHTWSVAGSGTAGATVTFTQAMTLDASGQLGIGTTSPTTKLYVEGTVSARSGSTGIQIYGTGGSGEINSVGSNPLIFNVNSSEKMRLDTSGNLGLGVTPSTWDSSIKALQVKGISVAGQDAGSGAWILSNARNNGGTWYYQANGYAQQYEISANNGQHRWSIAPSGTAGNAITFTQAMTLDASGYFLVGTTSNAYNGRITSEQVSTYAWAYVSSAANSGGTYFHIEFRPAGGSAVGNITSTSTTTSYNTSSDYRLKNIDGPLTGSGAFIDALKPKVGTWKANGSKFVGFLAHEVQEVSPNSVFGEKDGEQMQAMEYGSAEFIANIIAELQSLRARVAQLEAKGA